MSHFLVEMYFTERVICLRDPLVLSLTEKQREKDADLKFPTNSDIHGFTLKDRLQLMQQQFPGTRRFLSIPGERLIPQ